MILRPPRTWRPLHTSRRGVQAEARPARLLRAASAVPGGHLGPAPASTRLTPHPSARPPQGQRGHRPRPGACRPRARVRCPARPARARPAGALPGGRPAGARAPRRRTRLDGADRRAEGRRAQAPRRHRDDPRQDRDPRPLPLRPAVRGLRRSPAAPATSASRCSARPASRPPPRSPSPTTSPAPGSASGGSSRSRSRSTSSPTRSSSPTSTSAGSAVARTAGSRRGSCSARCSAPSSSAAPRPAWTCPSRPRSTPPASSS